MLKVKSIRLDSGRLEGDARFRLTGNARPVFDWALISDQNGARQGGYRIKVSAGERLLWDSGWQAGESQRAVYQGEPLTEGKRLTAAVQVKDAQGAESPWREEAFYYGNVGFEPHWVCADRDEKGRALYFKRDFEIEKPVREAYLYACGLGYHQLYLDGESIDGSRLDPATSDYTKTCYTAMVPDLQLKQGLHRLGIVVGDGWRRNEGPYLKALGERQVAFFGQPMLMARLVVCFEDGENRIVDTSEGFEWAHGGIVQNNLFNGECYDARQASDGCFPGFPKEGYRKAMSCEGPGGALKLQTLEPIREDGVYKALTLSNIRPGVWVADFGQNIAGVTRIRLPKGMKAGQSVRVSHMEFLSEDGSLYMDNLRGAQATDCYTASGDGRDLDIYQPLFTYHGFRYAQIEGWPGPMEVEDIEAVALRTALSNRSFFECGDPMLNKIHQNAVMTERANMHSILTDCPQRDERMGWMNDATVRFEETPLNFDAGRMFEKVISDLMDGQSEDGAICCTAPFVYGSRPADPVCSSYLVAGMESLLYYGNTALIERAYEGFKAWEECLLSHSENDLVNYSYYGDWAGPAYACEGDDGARSIVTPGEFMSTGYSLLNARLLKRFAETLGKAEEQAHYQALEARIQKAMLDHWYDEKSATMATGSNACQAFALWLGILPEKDRQRAADKLHLDLVNSGYRFTTGNLCTRYMMDVLAQYGYVEDAYFMLTRKDYPSYGFMIENEATTIWERFELKKNPGMNSHNHPMYGAVDYWFYAYLAGIQMQGAAASKVVIRPYMPKELLSVNAMVDTIKGDLAVKWVRRYGKVHLYLTIPVGMSAQVEFLGKRLEVESGFTHLEGVEA